MTNRKNVIANRYEVVQHIGQGGMADVFRAVDTILNREVAIKILRADLSTDAVSILRFEREAQAASALAHPNIVEIYDVGDYKGHHYIVMEYVPGRTLKQVIRARGPLMVDEAVDIMKQLTSAVAEAHTRGIIHRDLKPQNVIVKADGTVKILDFGIATAKGSIQLTQANNVMGSVHYLAPELARGESASPQSDIYALGIVLYEMLAGDVPFKADAAVQVALKHMRNKMPDIHDANPTVPQSVANVIIRATAKDPRNRYKSCYEMLRDLSTSLTKERLNEAPLVIRDPEPEKKEEEKPRETKAKPVSRTQKEEKKPAEPETHTVSPLVIGIVGLVVAAGIFFGLLFAGIIRFGPREVAVPQIEGMTVSEARTVCEESGLILDSDEVEYVLTTNIEKGLIVSVEPAEGTVVEEETHLSVVVSSGIGVYIEDFADGSWTISKAQQYISETYPYLVVNAVEEKNPAAGGTVIRQEQLEAGTLFSPEVMTNITLYYAAYDVITIPTDLIGMPVNEAVAKLESLGVENVRVINRDVSGMSQDEIDKLEFGVVIEVTPSMGESYTDRDDTYIILYCY